MPWPDWFGAKTLKKAAGTPDAPTPAPAAGIDIAAMAQQQADAAAKAKTATDADALKTSAPTISPRQNKIVPIASGKI